MNCGLEESGSSYFLRIESSKATATLPNKQFWHALKTEIGATASGFAVVMLTQLH